MGYFYTSLDLLKKRYGFESRNLRGIYAIYKDKNHKKQELAKKFIDSLDFNFWIKNTATLDTLETFFRKVEDDNKHGIYYSEGKDECKYYTNKVKQHTDRFTNGNKDEYELCFELCCINYFNKKLKRSLKKLAE